MRRLVSASALAIAVACLATAQAQASFPGPNGRIVFSRTPSGNQQMSASDIYAVNPDGSGMTRLTVSGTGIQPAWSPDSKRIAFGQTFGIVLIDADGAHETPLAAGTEPSWSPDGSRIAYSWAQTGNLEIWAMSTSGAPNQLNLTQNGGIDFSPSWSPDGSRIAFISIRTATFDSELFVMNADGTNQTNLTNSPSSNELGPPSWSPDGTRLAYSVSHDGIWVSNTDGSGAARLTTNPDGDIEPAWSPDGRQIVFSRQYQGSCTAPPIPSAAGQCRQLWIVNADGSGLRQLTENPGGGDASPSWGSAPLVVPPPPEDVIVHERAAPPISAYGGRLAWSSYDPQTKRYSLVTWLPGLSEPQTVAVKPRSVAFDVDLGPDSHGHTVAVYSRCRREQSPGAVGTSRGCDLYIYDFISRRETRIRSTGTPGGSEFLPTIWGSRIAFARNWEQRKGRAGRVSYLYTRLLTKRSRSTRLAGGPFGEGGPGPTSLDLRGTRLAMTWGWFIKHGRERWSRVQLDTIGGATKRVAQAVSINTSGATLLSASLASDGVYWVALGDTALKAPELVDSFRRYDLRNGAITAAAAPSGVASAARDSGRLFYMRGSPPADYLVGRVVPEFAPLPAIP